MTIANPTNAITPRGHVAVTPHNDNNLPKVVVGLRVGSTAGNVRVLDSLGNDTTIPGVQVGETIPGRFVKVFATGTTATGITGYLE